MLSKLNFPQYKFRIREVKSKLQIFDVVRKKYVELAPEEWVRQHVLHFCFESLSISPSLMGVEKQIKINDTVKRFDVVCFNRDLSPKILVECKSPDVKLTNAVAEQSLRYNLVLKADFVWITNGIENYIKTIDNQIVSLEVFSDLYFKL